MPEHVATPGQTVGPFFHYALPYERDRELVPPGSPASVLLHGLVLDGDGAPIPDALVEIRQADRSGAVPRIPGSLRRDGRFTGWGRCSTDRGGRYWFSTLEPATTDGGAAFFAVTVFARGLLDGLFTRIYLPESPGLDEDRLLSALPADERMTLVAARDEDGSLRHDIHLQGDRETAFLTFPGHP
jgi:protocatechuate 3,4-dioxygenase, alpha subunit